MKRLDLNGNESTSMVPVDVGTGTKEEKVAPGEVGVEDGLVKPDAGYAMRLSTIRFVKKAVIIAKSLETKLWFLAICPDTDGTVKSCSAKYLIEVSASRSTSR
jgi:hypothetical protein